MRILPRIACTQISTLKKFITESIRETPLEQLPKAFCFQEELNSPTYIITIEVEPTEFFTDSRGVKWQRVE